MLILYSYSLSMTTLVLFLSILGSLGLFLFGMKLMSESLQKIMGDRLRYLLSAMSSNKIRGVFTGILIAILLQSSSATTMMIVSFVNAGLVRLGEAFLVIMGANIGSTLTAWVISIFGFRIVNLSWAIFPVIGLVLPLAFSKKRKMRTYGEMFIGFCIVLISFIFIRQIIPTIYECRFLHIINWIQNLGFGGVLFFFAIGAIFAFAIRSSNATFLLTISLFASGWISFDLAVAMVIGENVGTSVTAVQASRIANTAAKRAAFGHLVFNLLGAVWSLLLFSYFIQIVAKVNIFFGGADPMDGPALGAMLALPIAHTFFNLFNTLLLFGFTRILAEVVNKIAPATINPDTDFRLLHIRSGMLSTPDASLYQARRETAAFAERVRKMYRNVERLFCIKNEKEFEATKEKIMMAKDFSNRLEKEIANYLTKVGEMRLSESSSMHLRGLYKMIDDLKSISESCVNITSAIEHKRFLKIDFPEQIHNNIQLIFNMVNEALDIMVTMLTHEEETPLSMAQETEREINNYRDILKSDHLNNLQRGIYNYDAGIIYNDIISQSERIGDFAIDVDESYRTLVSFRE